MPKIIEGLTQINEHILGAIAYNPILNTNGRNIDYNLLQSVAIKI